MQQLPEKQRRRCKVRLVVWGAVSLALLAAFCAACLGRHRWGTTGDGWAAVVQLGGKGVIAVGWIHSDADDPEVELKFSSPEMMTYTLRSLPRSPTGEVMRHAYSSFSSFGYSRVMPVQYDLDEVSPLVPGGGESVVEPLANQPVNSPFPRPQHPAPVRLRRASVPLYVPLAFALVLATSWAVRLRRARLG